MRIKTDKLDREILKLLAVNIPKEIARMLGVNRWRVYNAIRRSKSICKK